MKKFDLAGLRLDIGGERGAIRQAVQNAFPLCQTKSGDVQFRLIIREIERRNASQLIPSWLMHQINDLTPDAGATLLRDPDNRPAVVLLDGAILLCAFSKNEDHVYQLVAVKPAHAFQTFCIEELLLPLLRELFLTVGGLLFHGAGVVCPRGRGHAFFAAASGGKTTSTLALLNQGAKILADDLIVTRHTPDGVTIAGISEYINVGRHTMKSFCDLDRGVVVPHKRIVGPKTIPNSKVKIHAQAVYGRDCYATSAPLEDIYFISKTRQGPMLEPIPPSQAMGHLIRANTFARGQFPSGKGASMLFELLSYTKSYLLHTGPDPVAKGEWLLTFFLKNTAGKRQMIQDGINNKITGEATGAV